MSLKVLKFSVLFLITVSVMSGCTGTKFITAASELKEEEDAPQSEKAPCPTNQKYNAQGFCVPVTTGLPSQVSVTPSPSTVTQSRTPASMPSTVNQPMNQQPATQSPSTSVVSTTPACSNGAINSPNCNLCNDGFIYDGGTCVKGCGKQDHFTWGLMFTTSYNNRCSAYLPKLREGESRLVQSETPNPGFIKVSCVNSQYVTASEPAYQSHQDNDWQRYQVKVFFGQSIDIACHNDKILFQQPRLWESCETNSTATCFAAYGNQPTETNACWTVKVLMDDQGINKTTIVNGKTVGQNFNTQYRVYIKTSKDGFSASHDITNDIRAGFGLPMDSNQPQELYAGRPPGFSFVARKDMIGHQIKVFVEAKTFLNGQVKQSNTAETLIKVRDNPGCVNNYDGTGVANFAIGGSLPYETTATMVRRGYAWPLQN